MQERSMKVKKNWHKGFFENSFYNPASPLAVKRAAGESVFIARVLRLKKGAKILDLCCGPGRHSILLAKRGFEVTGLDFSREYLSQASVRARKAGVKVRLLRADMRKLEFNGEFDAVINMFTSFGYFPKFGDDLKVLKGIKRALKPGGLFLLDMLNKDWLCANFKPKDWFRLEDGTYQLEKREWLGKKTQLLSCCWIKIKPGKPPKERRLVLRQYNRRDISKALHKAGLQARRFWGDLKGGRLGKDSNRLVVMAKN